MVARHALLKSQCASHAEAAARPRLRRSLHIPQPKGPVVCTREQQPTRRREDDQLHRPRVRAQHRCSSLTASLVIHHPYTHSLVVRGGSKQSAAPARSVGSADGDANDRACVPCELPDLPTAHLQAEGVDGMRPSGCARRSCAAGQHTGTCDRTRRQAAQLHALREESGGGGEHWGRGAPLLGVGAHARKATTRALAQGCWAVALCASSRRTRCGRGGVAMPARFYHAH